MPFGRDKTGFWVAVHVPDPTVYPTSLTLLKAAYRQHTYDAAEIPAIIYECNLLKRWLIPEDQNQSLRKAMHWGEESCHVLPLPCPPTTLHHCYIVQVHDECCQVAEMIHSWISLMEPPPKASPQDRYPILARSSVSLESKLNCHCRLNFASKHMEEYARLNFNNHSSYYAKNNVPSILQVSGAIDRKPPPNQLCTRVHATKRLT